MSKYLFVTGKLALKALERTLAALNLDGGYRVEALGITVASLMSTEFIARHLKDVPEDVIVIPGLCNGPVALIEDACHHPAVKGPDDLKDLPLFLGRETTAQVTTEPKLMVLAEIVDAPRLTVSGILRRAAYYKANGAGIIDLGTDVYGDFPHLAEAVRALRAEGYKVSIDSMKPNDIVTAVNAGAEMVLSINSSNLEIAYDLDCRLVVVPDEDRNLETLFANVEKLLALKKDIVIDSILPPLMFGFTEGVVRYASVRERFPSTPLLMGLGNVTELAEADTTGMNAVLVAIATELDVDYVLTTECGSRTRGTVKEIDTAKKLMHNAKEAGTVPKHLDDSLLTVKDSRVTSYTDSELREMQALVTDTNYRIFTAGEDVYIFNATTFLCGRDADTLFKQLTGLDAAHAFYLGRELYKAELALRLGKKYVQDSDLRWGYLSKA
jgi:dihydropteroate synthase-like protein